MKYDSVHTKIIKNSFSNIGRFGELKVVNIMNMLQDIAVEYSIKLEISSKDLAGLNLFWVISRYQIEINDTAQLNDDLKITVTRNTHKRLYDLRWFKIETKSNKIIANAIGSWVIVNKLTGNPCHLGKFMTDEMLCENTTCVEKFFKNLKEVKRIDHEHTFKIRIHDLDLNRHVNNSSYVEWAVESLPKEILNHFLIKKINIIFKKESFYPGNIVACAQINYSPDYLTTRHSIFNESKNQELARINIIWKPFEKRKNDTT